jgi:single-stranded DNA-binding protein
MFTSTISGRVGAVRDKDYGDGKAKLEISIAVKIGRGEREKTAWFNVDCGIGKQADFYRAAVKKGDLVSAAVRVYSVTTGQSGDSLNFNAAVIEMQPPPKQREAGDVLNFNEYTTSATLEDMPF